LLPIEYCARIMLEIIFFSLKIKVAFEIIIGFEIDHY
jgi:hypothetical protein